MEWKRFKENDMLCAIAATLVSFWLLGLMTGYTMGSLIHVLFAAAIVLLVISVKQEVRVDERLSKISHARRYKKIHSGGIGL
jgi:uncharacterized membrane protein